MSDYIWSMLVAALIGLIFGGAGTTFVGLIPIRTKLAQLELTLKERLVRIEGDLKYIEEKVNYIAGEDRRKEPRHHG